jgi:molybdopterin-guanine dinucleotide biosynthesis protein A
VKIAKQEAVKVVKRYDQVSAFILCGGASSRMGKAKGLLEFGGQPLILRTARLLEPLVFAVTAIGSPEPYADLGLHVIGDRQFGSSDKPGSTPGPLAGIASALSATRTDWNLILACDLPYLTADWVDWLLARARDSSREIVMPRTAGGPEPLAAVYRRECAKSIIAALRRGVRKVTDAMEQFRIEFVTERDWRHVDPAGRVLRNMNALEDYEEARRSWEAVPPATFTARQRRPGSKATTNRRTTKKEKNHP